MPDLRLAANRVRRQRARLLRRPHLPSRQRRLLRPAAPVLHRRNSPLTRQLPSTHPDALPQIRSHRRTLPSRLRRIRKVILLTQPQQKRLIERSHRYRIQAGFHTRRAQPISLWQPGGPQKPGTDIGNPPVKYAGCGLAPGRRPPPLAGRGAALGRMDTGIPAGRSSPGINRWAPAQRRGETAAGRLCLSGAACLPV